MIELKRREIMFSLKIELQNVVVLNMSITCWTWQFWVEYFAETGGDHMTYISQWKQIRNKETTYV
jgi:hypothetical protein